MDSPMTPPRAATTTTAPALPVLPTTNRIIVMCKRQKRQLAQFDPVKLAAALEAETAEILTRAAMYLYCKHCKMEHGVDFATLVSATDTRFLWI